MTAHISRRSLAQIRLQIPRWWRKWKPRNTIIGCNLAIYSILHFVVCQLIPWPFLSYKPTHQTAIWTSYTYPLGPSRHPWLWIYRYFLTISDNQIDGQKNESEIEVNAVGDSVQNTAQISKLIYRYNKLSVCLWVDTKMLVRDILTYYFSLIIYFMSTVSTT